MHSRQDKQLSTAMDATTYTMSSELPAGLEKELSLLEVLHRDLDLTLTSRPESIPSSETTTLSGRHDSLSSTIGSLCSSRTSNCSSTLSTTAKPAKRVRFEESVSWSFFDNCEGMARPQLQKRPSFMSRSWDRITTRNTFTDSDIGVPPAALSAMTENLHHLKRRNSSVDLAELAMKTTSRYAIPGNRASLVLTVQQPLRESAGRRYNGTETKGRFRAARHAPKGDWDDLLGPPKSNPLAVV